MAARLDPRLLAAYRNQERVESDVAAFIAQVPDFRLAAGSVAGEGGSTRVFCLIGVMEYAHQNGRQLVKVGYYLPLAYPAVQPRCVLFPGKGQAVNSCEAFSEAGIVQDNRKWTSKMRITDRYIHIQTLFIRTPPILAGGAAHAEKATAREIPQLPVLTPQKSSAQYVEKSAPQGQDQPAEPLPLIDPQILLFELQQTCSDAIKRHKQKLELEMKTYVAKCDEGSKKVKRTNQQIAEEVAVNQHSSQRRIFKGWPASQTLSYLRQTCNVNQIEILNAAQKQYINKIKKLPLDYDQLGDLLEFDDVEQRIVFANQ